MCVFYYRMGCQSAFAIVEHDGASRRFKSARASLDLVCNRVNLETVQSRHKLFYRLLWSIIWMNHEEHVREAGTKICAVTVMMSRTLWIVNVHTLGTVKLHHCLSGNIAQTYGKTCFTTYKRIERMRKGITRN